MGGEKGLIYGILAAVVRPSQSVMANASWTWRGWCCCGKITRIYSSCGQNFTALAPLVNFAALSCQIFAGNDGIFFPRME